MANPDGTPTAAEIAASGPTDTGTADALVGVPKGYKPAQVPANYKAYVTSDKFLPAGIGFENIAALQDRMEAAGLYVPGQEPSRTGRRGYWDSRIDVAPWTDILTNANARGISYGDALDDLLSIANQNGGAVARAKAASTRAPLVTHYTHPDDLKYVAQKTAQQTLGRNLTDDDLAQFMKGYHSMEGASQATAYDEGGTAGAGGAVTDPAAVAASADAFAQAQHPDQAYAKNYIDSFNVLDQMIKGSAPGAQPSGTGGTSGV